MIATLLALLLAAPTGLPTCDHRSASTSTCVFHLIGPDMPLQYALANGDGSFVPLYAHSSCASDRVYDLRYQRCIDPLNDEWAPATSSTPEHWHCWHARPERHAIYDWAGHEDQVCCHCGKERCHRGFLPDPCKDHGKFAPGCEWVLPEVIASTSTRP